MIRKIRRLRRFLYGICTLAIIAHALSGCAFASSTAKAPSANKLSISGPYTVTATYQPHESTYYYIGTQYIDENTMAGIINSYDADENETTIELTAKEGCTKCVIIKDGIPYSYYCDGNLLAGNRLNIIEGGTIRNAFQNMLANAIHEEDVMDIDGSYSHIITNVDNKSKDIKCKRGEDGEINSLYSTCDFDGYSFDIGYFINPEIPTMDITDCEKVEGEDLADIINKLSNYMFSTVANHESTPDIDISAADEEEETAEEEEEDTSIMMTEQIATLPETRDLIVKVTFSNNVEDVEFISPTGGSYKVSSGNVEFMRDDAVSRDAYYKIPGAEMGTWKMQYDNAKNDITFEAICDNKIKIDEIVISDIKDGVLTVMPTLKMDKGIDINYEYHVNTLDNDETITHTTNILNAKTDKAKYNVSVMNLSPGTYKIRLRIEYMYDGQHYIDIKSSEGFTIEPPAIEDENEE